jgi:hypothetical protein
VGALFVERTAQELPDLGWLGVELRSQARLFTL